MALSRVRRALSCGSVPCEEGSVPCEEGSARSLLLCRTRPPDEGGVTVIYEVDSTLKARGSNLLFKRILMHSHNITDNMEVQSSQHERSSLRISLQINYFL